VDAVHTHQVGAFMYGVAAASMLGIPSVHTEHGEQLFATVRVRGMGGLRTKLSYQGDTDALLSGAGDIAARTLLIANGIALRTRPTRFERAHVRTQLGIGEDAFVFGSVARWSTQGEAAQLVEAFARAAEQHPQALLVIACDGSTRTQLSARATTLGIDGRVRLLGQPDDIAAWLPALDAFALTSMHARAVLEAMAASVPVIATAVGGLPSLLRNGAGAMLATNDLTGVTQLMSAFINSPWLCDAYATLGRARVEAEHSERAMITAYSVLYRAACAPHKSAEAKPVRCVASN
jgi:glycosyltransferase involved in cell wall biosynthesis